MGTGDDAWSGAGDGGAALSLADVLIFDRTDAQAPLSPVFDPVTGLGWRGPYLVRVPADPWGHPFVCNVRYLRGAGVAGVTTASVVRASGGGGGGGAPPACGLLGLEAIVFAYLLARRAGRRARGRA